MITSRSIELASCCSTPAQTSYFLFFKIVPLTKIARSSNYSRSFLLRMPMHVIKYALAVGGVSFCFQFIWLSRPVRKGIASRFFRWVSVSVSWHFTSTWKKCLLSKLILTFQSWEGSFLGDQLLRLWYELTTLLYATTNVVTKSTLTKTWLICMDFGCMCFLDFLKRKFVMMIRLRSSVDPKASKKCASIVAFFVAKLVKDVVALQQWIIMQTD